MSTYRLRGDRLGEAAAAKGDLTSYAIAKRTGLAESTLSRLRRGVAKPATGSLLILAATYGLTLEELLDDDAAGNGDGTEVAPSAPPVGRGTTSTSQ